MLNIPKTHWDGVVPDPVPWPFSHQKSKKLRNVLSLESVTFGG